MTKIAIIGGGLAGTACAYVLKDAGLEPVIYEAGPALASGASGNMLGLYNPRLSAARTVEAEYYIRGFELAWETFPSLCHPDQAKRVEGSHLSASDPSTAALRASAQDDSNAIDFTSCGALHLINTEQKAVRFPKTVQNWGWAAEDMRLVDEVEASDIAGVELTHKALYLPRSGYVSPQKLCAAYAEGVEVHLNASITDLADIKADAAILACGMGVLDFPSAAHLPLKGVRGQVTHVKATAESAKLACALCYGGYFTPAHGGTHMLGATFQRWLSHSDAIAEDDADNMAGLASVVPDLAQGLEIAGHRAAMRTTAPDHFPIVGALEERVYLSIAHGSHGILSSLVAAHVLRDMITGCEFTLSHPVIERLSPRRYDDA